MPPSFARLAKIALALAGPLVATGELPFTYETTPGRLPKSVVPRHYDLRVQPDVADLTFSGSVRTEIEVLEPSDRIVMNALNLVIDDATFDGTEVPVAIDEALQILTLLLPSAASTGNHILTATFRGKINAQANGLFFDRYPTASGEKLMLGTQFEVADARQVFPCWDEPVFRATFNLTAVVPEHFMAVSNMPESWSRLIGDGLREVAFARTPSMSTYLLAFFAGEFEVLEGESESVAVRIITTEGKRDSAAYALESAKRILAFMNGYFGVPYPLPKLDLIGVPNAFATFGAMENWGCISFIDSILLFDPETGSQSTRQQVFAILAHEIAHQWFGNIVTMAWWDNLWLNEGFATWMGNKTTESLNPGWDLRTRSAAGRESAMTFDAGPTTHAVQVVIADENEAKYSFDTIAYSKGRAILDMLEDYVGDEAFQAGVRDYIDSHQFSSTTTADLWAALDRSSGLRVSELASGWTDKPGFPVIHVSESAHGDQIVLRQERFEIGQWNTGQSLWRIPITVANTDNLGAARVVLLEGESLGIPMPPGDGAVKVNTGAGGFYRTHYEGNLAKRLNAGAARLPVPDQVGLLVDNWALMEAGITPAPVLLDLIESLRDSTEPVVWSRITLQMEAIDRLAKGRMGRDAFRAWAISLLAPQLERVGWSATAGESLTQSEFRSSLITTLGLFGHEPTIAECRRRFAEFSSTPESVPADIRSAIFSVVGRHADPATYESLHAFAQSSLSTLERTRAYQAMQRAADPILARRTMALSLTDSTPPSIRTWNVVRIAENENQEIAWEFVQANLAALLATIPNDAQFNLVPLVMRTFNDRERADELLVFVGERFPAAAMNEALKAADLIRRRAATRDREMPRIDDWIAAHRR